MVPLYHIIWCLLLLFWKKKFTQEGHFIFIYFFEILFISNNRSGKIECGWPTVSKSFGLLSNFDRFGLTELQLNLIISEIDFFLNVPSYIIQSNFLFFSHHLNLLVVFRICSLSFKFKPQEVSKINMEKLKRSFGSFYYIQYFFFDKDLKDTFFIDI